MENNLKDKERKELKFDPMSADFALNRIGLQTEHDGNVTEGLHPSTVLSLFQDDAKPKNIPCKFHDGVSGTCWKGKSCVYSHEPFTGGKFTEENPEVSALAKHRREVTCVVNLCPQPFLQNEAHIDCIVTHVVSPSEFYVWTKDPQCVCKAVDKAVEKARKEESKSCMDNYYHGFSALENPEGLLEKDLIDNLSSGRTVTEKLTKYLAHPGRKIRQHEFYFPKVELVAVKTERIWKRAIVLPTVNIDKEDWVKVQFLDTGEKMKVMKKYVCQLPEQFCRYHAEAFKCCVFGISPVGLVWCRAAIGMFKELVLSKELMIIVKDRPREAGNAFETRPYIVQLMVKSENCYSDVAEKLIGSCYAYRWPKNSLLTMPPHFKDGNVSLLRNLARSLSSKAKVTYEESDLESDSSGLFNIVEECMNRECEFNEIDGN